jgi:hypothetical protein
MNNDQLVKGNTQKFIYLFLDYYKFNHDITR